jgi:hypothetical protein
MNIKQDTLIKAGFFYYLVENKDSENNLIEQFIVKGKSYEDAITAAETKLGVYHHFDIFPIDTDKVRICSLN